MKSMNRLDHGLDSSATGTWSEGQPTEAPAVGMEGPSLMDDGKVAEESLTIDAEEEEEEAALPPSTSKMTSTADEKADGDGGGGSGEAAMPREDMRVKSAEIGGEKDTGIKAEEEAGSSINADTQGEENSAGLGGAKVKEESQVQGSTAPGGEEVDSQEMCQEAKKSCDACRGMHRAHTCERALPKPPSVIREVAPEIVLNKRLPKPKKMMDSPVKKVVKEEQPKRKRCPPSSATVPLLRSLTSILHFM